MAFSQLPPVTQQAVARFFMQATFITSEEYTDISHYVQDGGQVIMSAGPSCGCGTHSKKVDLWAGPVKVGTYFSDTSWCWDGVFIAGDPFFNAYGWVYQPLWEFVGNQSVNESGGDGDAKHSDFGQGHFRMCVGPAGCVANLHPVIQKSQYGDGRKE